MENGTLGAALWRREGRLSALLLVALIDQVSLAFFILVGASFMKASIGLALLKQWGHAAQCRGIARSFKL